MTGPGLLDRIDGAQALGRLADRDINFDDHEIGPVGWHHDDAYAPLPAEEPGPPAPDGSWSAACRLVAAYEFCDPAVLRAVYRADADLTGRDMLLEARFLLLRFYMGVRITQVIDEKRPCERCARGDQVWGWVYETLQGHLERGRMSYEVVKHQDSGQVELVIHAVSQPTSAMGPLVRLGWTLFGRRTQLRFYRSCGERLRAAVAARPGGVDVVPARRCQQGLVLAPSDAGPRWSDRLAIRHYQTR